MTQGTEERRVVTMLFADLVGSTALTEKVHPEEAKLILGDAVARLITVVESYGGYVKDLAGDGLLAFFGAPTAHEDDPERATRAGLDMTEMIGQYAEEVRRGWGFEGFAVRVGIHTGEVIVGPVGGGQRVEFGAFGDAVNTAARIQAAAPPGAVLVTDATRRLVADRFQWGRAQELDLKGKTAPVTAFRVSGTIGGQPAAAPGGGGAARMVGREAELVAGQEMVEAAVAGQGGVLFIVGEPGIGKSRLAAELHQFATESGCTWLEGRCVSYGEGLPYWPYRDLLRAWLGLGMQEPEVRMRVLLMRRLEEVFGAETAGLYPYLASVMGLEGETGPGSKLAAVSPEAIQYRTFEIFTDLVGRLAASRPVTLHIDDLHWADRTSLQLTEQLLTLVETAPVLLVFSLRPETEHEAWALKEKSARDYRHLHRELALGALGETAERDLVTALAGSNRLGEGAQATVLEAAGGNPFYIEELVRSLAERGRPGEADPADTSLLPKTLEGVILARIDRLQPAWREVVTSASVLGRSFGFDLLRAATEVDAGPLREAVHHLLRLDLLMADRSGQALSYRFKHALIQEAAYKTLVKARRAAIHRRAAEWFETFYAGRLERVYGLIAHHWERAEDVEKAAEYAELAGDRALNDWALDAAIEHYRQLLLLVKGTVREGETAELLFRLATTLHLAMRFREANEVWAEAFRSWETRPATQVEATATLRIGSLTLPWSRARSMGYYAINQQLVQQLNDSLAVARRHPYLVPHLARSWEVSDDGLRYIIRLRESTWSDGAPLLARDMVDTYLLSLEPGGSPSSSLVYIVEGAEERVRLGTPRESVGVHALDDHTVEIRLRRPSPYFIFLFVYPEFLALRDDATNGPFQIERMDADAIILERVAGYERGRGGNVKRVEWERVSEEALLDPARASEFDVFSAPTLVDRLAAPEHGLRPAAGPQTLSLFVAFPGEGALEVDVHLRRALALSIDRGQVLPLLRYGQSVATGGLVPPDLPGHSPGIALGYDLEAARAELALSTYRRLLKVVCAVEQRAPYQEVLVEGWRRDLGLEIELAELPLATNHTWRGIAQVSLWHWVAHAPDPEYFLRNLLHGGMPTRAAGWHLPELDDLLDRALAAASGAERLALFHQADRLAIREACVIPVAYGGVVTFHQRWVHGWWHWGAPWQSWDELTIDPTSPRAGG